MKTILHLELTTDELIEMIGLCAVIEVVGIERVQPINKRLETELSKAFIQQDPTEINNSCNKYLQLEIFNNE